MATQLALAQWQRDINRINTDPAEIRVENNVDLEGPPPNFTYIAKNFAGEGVIIPNDPIVGCECTSCIDEQKNCCGHRAGSSFAYYKRNKRVRLAPGYSIYECNDKCACGPGMSQPTFVVLYNSLSVFLHFILDKLVCG